MKQGDLLFWIWLAEALGTGNPDFRHLADLYETPYDLFQTEEAELERIPELSARSRAKLAEKNLRQASEILDSCQRLGIGILTYADHAYPQSLREIKDPPILLYYAGTVPEFSKRLCIGMVGTRRMSAYGLESAYKLSYEVATAGAVVVSGMAAGIDGICAAAAMEAGAPTVAVLGCGLDIAYPKHHGKLMQKIAQNGLLLSEYPPGTEPAFYHFPERNRIISGLSQAVVVVEAGLGSGSLITAKDAVLQGRDVFAVPANMGNADSEGTNGLLRDGAFVAMEGYDILSRYQYLYAETLFPEKSRQKQNLRANRTVLEALGVIPKETETPEPAPVPTAQTTPPSRRRNAEPNPREPVAGKPEKKIEPQPETERPREAAKAPDAIVQGLSPVQRGILEMIPDDCPAAIDTLTASGYSYGDVMAALTMLEIMGLIKKLPGSMYAKA